MNDENSFTPNIDLLDLEDEKLSFYHKVLHFYFKINQSDKRKPYGWSQKEIFLVHSNITTMFKEKGLTHERCDLLDDITCFDEDKKPLVEFDAKIFVSEEELTNAIFEKEKS